MRRGSKTRLGTTAFVALVALSAILIVLDGCRDPTQVTVEITTNAACSDVRGVAISVAASANEAESRGLFPTTIAYSCDSKTGLIGTLVITPGELGSGGSIVVAAGVLVPVEQCKPPTYPGCIVARRQFTFIDHTPLKIPIDLPLDCRDVPCNATTTCRRGSCVDSRIECGEEGCTPIGGGITPTSSSGDSGSDSDAGVVDDAAKDAPSADAPIDTGGGGDCGEGVVSEGNAWGFLSCQYAGGGLCVGYTIGHCADQSAYGNPCMQDTPPVCGAAVCNTTDKRSTTYRCLHSYCAHGCVPGGGSPDWSVTPVFTCEQQAGCGP